MKKMIILFLLSLIYLENLPNDVKWVKNSKEYEALCHQIYNTALKQLDLYLLSNKNQKNFAVVMDLDETVLDNSQYQIELHEKNETFNMESWAAWVKREEAGLVPGVYDYISLLRGNNIQIIFISNRMDERLKSTKNNMK